ncbi:MAG: protein translocase subunit SecF, partial [Simkaniaceae bacterium]|nr:protein translocase subunit SecF [Simkaniaceae bacterium]
YRGDSILDWNQQNNPLLIVFNNYALEGADLDHIHAGFDPAEGNFLSFEVNSSRNSTGNEHINPRNELYNWTSIFSKEKVIGTSYEKFSSGEGWRMAVILNGQVISSPQLAQPLKTNGRITGSFTQREIAKLEADLKAGSLTFTPYILSEKNVSPELGIKERRSGIIATVIALSLVIAVMVVYYRFAGVIASVAVLLNLLIMWATLQNLQATITLATIAGIILTMGMAVDANVLIFERIREEFTQSGRIALAIQTGYKKAFSAILDSNITTIIAALILLNFDSGPIKGFALSLIIGIVSSMFTALFFTRCFFRIWVQKPEHKTLNMLNWIRGSHFNFLKFGKPAFVVVALIALIGAFSLTKEKSTILGMDFTGGYALTLEVKPSEQTNYRQIVEKAFEKHGLTSHDFSVRELTPSNQLRIFLAKNLERQGQPFAGLSYDIDPSQTEFAYQTNPKIVWIVNALQESGIALTEASIDQLDTNWTSISGQMSDSMRNNAIIGLGIALICILLYITFRFEFKFAMSATIALAIDVVVTLALIAILHLIGVPVQIDLNTIAALMTIIGYSLNDTIIVFDRIREDMKTKRKESLFEIINHSLNVTLSRTIMTSLTTFVVLIALIVFGGQTIFGFSLVMAIGVVIGTLSTLFIASLLLHSFQKKESSNSSRAILSMQ